MPNASRSPLPNRSRLSDAVCHWIQSRKRHGETTSHKARLDAMQGKTLREALSTGYERGLNFIGSPQTIAPQMNEVIEATGRHAVPCPPPILALTGARPAECPVQFC